MICALIAAAGSGTRTGLKDNKIFFDIDGRSVIERSVGAFLEHDRVDGAVIVCAEKDKARLEGIFGDRVEYVLGGDTRGESVKNGLNAIFGRYDKVLIHDGARPFVTEEIIDRVIDNISEGVGAVACVRVTDTVKTVDGEGFVTGTPDRSTLFNAQTPQGFMTDEILAAYNTVTEQTTDDCAVFEAAGKRIITVEGGYFNKKITTAEDVCMPKVFLSGIGYDVHRLVPERRLVLGGVTVPHELGLLGHSDADVLVHAIMDALLGAAGMHDIGRHFPDSDERYKGISSILLLKEVVGLLKDNGFGIVNISAVVMAQRPKLKPYIDIMNQNIADAIGIDVSRVNVAATTTEGLGFEGREEGISAQATAMLTK